MKRAHNEPKGFMVHGRIAVSGGTPSIAAGSGFTISDTAAGKVTITLDKPGSAIIPVACPVESTDATSFSCKIHGVPTAFAFIVSIYQDDATDGVLVDNVGFCFSALVLE
jgi:hypothetical protein